MDVSKYQPGKGMSDASEWLITNITNIDPASLTPYQETMLEGSIMIFLLILIAIVFK
jgi:hypothetical protein